MMNKQHNDHWFLQKDPQHELYEQLHRDLCSAEFARHMKADEGAMRAHENLAFVLMGMALELGAKPGDHLAQAACDARAALRYKQAFDEACKLHGALYDVLKSGVSNDEIAEALWKIFNGRATEVVAPKCEVCNVK